MEPSVDPNLETEKPQPTTAPLLDGKAPPEVSSEPDMGTIDVAEDSSTVINQPPIDTQPETPTETAELVADEANEPQSIVAPLTSPLKHRRSLTWLVVTLVLLANIGIAGATFYVRRQAADSTNLAADTATTTIKTTGKPISSSPAQPVSSDIKTLHYVSKPLGIEFDYPVDWRISSDASNSSINLTSAPFSFTDPTGIAQAVAVYLAITNTKQQANSYSEVLLGDGDTIAVASETLKYTSPTASQRATTNLSFARNLYQSGDNQQAIDTGFISGSYAYQAGSKVGSQEYTKVDPQIRFYLNPCGLGSAKCQAYNDTSFTYSDWQTNPNLQAVKALLTSLRIN